MNEMGLSQADAARRLNVSQCCSATLGSILNGRSGVQKTCSRPTTSYNTCRRHPFSASSARREEPLPCRSSLQTTFKHQKEESPLLRCEIVFTMQVCMQEDQLCAFPQRTTAKEPLMLGKRTCFLTQQQWASVLFTDESRFTMESDSGVY
ncbi:transposable element Tcb2 transposase [Trichonephila clavipes]|nr:transposable element Tcb2 transposase [Trichonephila clavipes]